MEKRAEKDFSLFRIKEKISILFPEKRSFFRKRNNFPFPEKIPLDFFQKRAIFSGKRETPFSTIGKKENKVCCSLTPIVEQVEPG